MSNQLIWVLFKGKSSIVAFIILVFLLIDIMLDLQIIYKMEYIWSPDLSGLIFVGIYILVLYGLIDTFISKVYFYDDFIKTKTSVREKIIYYKDIDKLNLEGDRGAYYSLYDHQGKLKMKIGVGFLKKKGDKKRFISLLTEKNPSIILDKSCERELLQNSIDDIYYTKN